MDPMELREQNWIKHEEFPFTTVCGLTYDSRQLRGRHREGAWSCSATTRCAREQQRAPRRAATRCSSASASRRSPRCAASRRRGCSARCRYGAGGWEHAAIRMLPTGKVEVVTGIVAARPGPRDGVEPDRRRPARRAVRGHRGAARRHPRLATRAWTPTARGRWPSAASRVVQGRGEGDREGQADRRAHAGGDRGRPRVHRRRVPGARARRTAARRSQDVALAVVRRARPARRRRADAGLRRHLRPGELLLPARHAPVRDRGRHRDRPGRRSASTSASTTSARWSTR